MKVGILGTRGIPSAYGGFETLAEELAARLSARGHDVTVYARRGAVSATVSVHRGARVVFVPTVRHKYLDTVVHGFLSGIHAAAKGFDAVLFCNGIN
ncbi:MAG TPA: glycosyltransferase, partial [Thermoanaerobaculia bacterium]|nr:glycosyltransferase [Thermoanaerobaculia bacterium]